VSLISPAHADSSATPGQGIATAYLLHLGIPYNGADLGVTLGLTNGQYQDSTAKASSQTFEPGVLTLISNLRVCNQSSLPPGLLPKPLEVDTDSSNGKPATLSTAGPSGPAVGAQSVSVAPNSNGTAENSGLSFALPGLVDLTNGHVHSEASWDPAHQVRTVTSSVDLGTLSLLNSLPLGGIQLGGLRWVLQQVVAGPDNRADRRSVTSSFTMGSAKVFGLTLPIPGADRAQQLFDSINALSAPFGLQLHAPKLVPDGQFGLAYTPFTIALGGKTLLGPLLSPLLGGASINQIERALSPGVFDTRSCNELGGLLKGAPALNAGWNGLGAAAPVVIGALAAAIDGQAEVDISVGNVRTSVDDTYYPFSTGMGTSGSSSTVPASSAASGRSGGTGGAVLGPDRAVQAPSIGAVALAPAPQRTLLNAGHVRCETTSPVGWPGCWKGNAPVAAGAAGALTMGLLVADEVFRRRRLAGAAAAAAREVSD
jgi:hypothetical protein